jgi:Na+-driven multidrug efflux pump
VGAVAAITSLQTNVTIALATALVASAAGTDAIAGYGTGVRLEYLLIPVIFGLGAPLVALVGTNIGAGHKQRALRIALVGGAIAFAIGETLGLIAALWPQAWLALFSPDPSVVETGSAYLRIVGPAYGFFGLGMALYFASQGAARLLWPLLAGSFRVIIAIGGDWLALRLTGSLNWLFATLALGLVVYGVVLTAAIISGAWYGRDRTLKDNPVPADVEKDACVEIGSNVEKSNCFVRQEAPRQSGGANVFHGIAN